MTSPLDHPRVRGDDIALLETDERQTRTTPARGRRATAGHHLLRLRAIPGVRGDDYPLAQVPPPVAGPPRVRGTTAVRVCGWRTRPDYPRGCGGRREAAVQRKTLPEPPPRARGRPYTAVDDRRLQRTTPHVRRDDRYIPEGVTQFYGPPPRARGRLVTVTERGDVLRTTPRGRERPVGIAVRLVGVRTTPACAGTTRRTCSTGSASWDHPRAWGRHQRRHPQPGDKGTTPLARDTPPGPVRLLRVDGATPALRG
jgi:hypothetical protein